MQTEEEGLISPSLLAAEKGRGHHNTARGKGKKGKRAYSHH